MRGPSVNGPDERRRYGVKSSVAIGSIGEEGGGRGVRQA